MATRVDVMSMDSEPPRGHKRSASDALDPEHRLSKRFNLLNIGMSARCSAADPLRC